jgi:uncharacterized protein (TIGR00156 family)
MTVAQALASRDDTNVVLRGTIVRSIGDERYTFKDTTGEVTIDVDNELWAGQLVSPQDTVEIHGEVDKEFMGGIEIDVSRITLVKQP